MTLRTLLFMCLALLAPQRALAECSPSAPPDSWAQAAPAVPATIPADPKTIHPLRLVIIRHAEKPMLSSGYMIEDGNIGEQGVKRAARLADTLLERFGCPDLLISTNPAVKIPNKITGQYFNYIRPLVTIAPLSGKIGYPVWTPYGYDQSDLLVRDLLGDKAFAPRHDGQTKTIFIAWERKNMPKLVANLVENGKLTLLQGGTMKADGETYQCEAPPTWVQCDFDSIWVLNIRDGNLCLSHKQEHLNAPAFQNHCKGVVGD